jgi:hypothetical protein
MQCWFAKLNLEAGELHSPKKTSSAFDQVRLVVGREGLIKIGTIPA